MSRHYAEFKSAELLTRLFADDPMGRFRFRQWLQQTRGSSTELASLDFATDVRCYEELLRHVRAIALGLHNQYLAPGASCELPVSSMEARAKTLESLRAVLETRATFEAVSKGLQHELYRNAWPAFIRTKIAEHAKVSDASVHPFALHFKARSDFVHSSRSASHHVSHPKIAATSAKSSA